MTLADDEMSRRHGRARGLTAVLWASYSGVVDVRMEDAVEWRESRREGRSNGRHQVQRRRHRTKHGDGGSGEAGALSLSDRAIRDEWTSKPRKVKGGLVKYLIPTIRAPMKITSARRFHPLGVAVVVVVVVVVAVVVVVGVGVGVELEWFGFRCFSQWLLPVFRQCKALMDPLLMLLPD